MSLLEEIYGDGKWIVSSHVAAGANDLYKLLSGWESETLVISASEGTGEIPDTEVVYTRSGGESIVDITRRYSRSVEDPDPEVLSAVDRFDPERKTRVIAEPHATSQTMVGRPTFGVRKPEWTAWEDKMIVDALWEKLGVAHARYQIVTPFDAPAAARELASPMGTVWTADNSQGWHGGGDFVRWVADPAQAESAAVWFADRAERVRVMPFLEGLPCSIHGWVTTSGVAVFLPVEINVLRHSDNSGLLYAGVSTIWDPPKSVVDEMREACHLVGSHLARTVGYIGPYGIDGVLTVDGFRPNEINPRLSAGAGVQLNFGDIPFGVLMRAEIEGRLQVDPVWLESAAIGQREPRIHLGKVVGVEVRDEFHVTRAPDGVLVASDRAEDAVGTVKAGPSSMGSYITGDFDTEKVGLGDPAGPFVAEVLNLANNRWNLGIPQVGAAPNLIR